MRQFAWFDDFWRDVRYALRMIAAKPGFSVPVLLTLALGIGGNIAIFSVVYAVLIRPLPYPQPERLVGVANSAVFSGSTVPDWPLSLESYARYQQGAHSFSAFGAWTANTSAITGTGEPEELATVSMTHGVLPALGVKPVEGRWFLPADELQGAPRAAILSYRYWLRKYNGDPGALGQTVQIDSNPYHIVGVMPKGFAFLNVTPEVFLAQTVAAGAAGSQDADYSGVARLKPGVSATAANQDLARVLANAAAQDGHWKNLLQQIHLRPNVHPLRQDVIGDVAGVLRILMGALLLVLLLVCANVASLVQVRAEARRNEFAVRAALGAGRGRLARQLMWESLMLGTMGGIAGLALAWLGLPLLVAHAPLDLAGAAQISVGAAGVGFAVLCALGSGAAFGWIAIVRLGSIGKLQNTRGATLAKEQTRSQNALVVAQVALALVLLVGAGLLVRSFLAMSRVQPGFNHPETLQTIRLYIPPAQVSSPARLAQMQNDILARLAALPGVERAAFASALPLEAEYQNGNPIAVDGKTPAGGVPPNRTIEIVSPGLFATLGTRLLAGRDFTLEEQSDQRPVAIVSLNMARQYWGSPRAALGHRIRVNGGATWSEIVGVAENVHAGGLDRPTSSLVYFPGTRRNLSFALRTGRAGTEGLRQEVAAAVHAVDPDLPLIQVRTLRDLYRLSVARKSFALLLMAIAAAMALALAVIGVYGVLAYAVSRRRKEIGIRLAVGAEPRAIRRLILRQGLLVTGAGALCGLVAALLLAPAMASLLFGIAPADPITMIAAAAAILCAAVAASYVPARRAASLDAIEVLRND
ncbi:MAG TPA: ABC transporter permease [Terriglobales bacterium]|nr:ABC transporter permease [Terriglobales bacterium]